MADFSKLDNPAWHSLSETHQPLSMGAEGIKFYRPSICPFGGIRSSGIKNLAPLDALIDTSEPFFIIGELPELPPHYELIVELVCLQMVCQDRIALEPAEKIVRLNERFGEDLAQLVNHVQPGYFKPETHLMGDYFGIFQEDKLVAVTGERMRMEGFAEISAVVTHPDFVGRGYAKQLVAHTVNKNLEHGIIPYLHVTETNVTAIRLYEKLGFQTRRKMSFWKISRLL